VRGADFEGELRASSCELRAIRMLKNRIVTWGSMLQQYATEEEARGGDESGGPERQDESREHQSGVE